MESFLMTTRMKMKVRNWLTVNSRGSSRLTKSKPHIDVDEVSVFLEIDIPNALFEKPRLEAKIKIPDEAAQKETINASVTENIEEAIKQVTGLDLRVNVIKEEEEDDNNPM